jgi:hypothetical protein
MGLNPDTVSWMDVKDASYYIQENTKIKVANWGTPKKIKKKIKKKKLKKKLF